MAEKLDLGLVALFIFKNGLKGDEKILDDANYEERENKSIRSVSTLYTWELSYSLAFSVLLHASMGPDVIICVCGCESAFLLILKVSIKWLVWLKGFQVCSSTLAFQR